MAGSAGQKLNPKTSAEDEGTETPFRQGYLTVTRFNGSRAERRYAVGEHASQQSLLLSADAVRHYPGLSVCERLFACSTVVNHAFTPCGQATAELLIRLEQAGDDTLTRQSAGLTATLIRNGAEEAFVSTGRQVTGTGAHG